MNENGTFISTPQDSGSADVVGVDHRRLGERFEQVLGLALRKVDLQLVIVTDRPTDFVYKMVQMAFESGHSVTLTSDRNQAPAVDRWLWE